MSGNPIRLKEADNRRFRGTRLPGSTLYKSEGGGFKMTLQQYRQVNFSLCLRHYQFSEKNKIYTKELIGNFRLEIVLSGELPIRHPDGEETVLLPGQYHITDQPGFQSLFPNNSSCSYLSIYFANAFIATLDLPEPLNRVPPRAAPLVLMETIYQILHNPFNEQWRSGYYRIGLEELLFRHGTVPPFVEPGNLTSRQIATVYEIDAYMAANLDSKITLQGIAQQVTSNSHFVRRGYELVFGVNIFDRLIQMRMDRAKYLLDNTEKPLKEIRQMVGYLTLAGFVTEFKKREGLPPNDWRKKRRKGI
ncbi:MAG: AraC family transcriptional regulator [Chitinophagaceae bacterium]